MSLGAVGQPRRSAPRQHPARRGRRELRDVRHPLRPDLRVERVVVCQSGIHVVTALTGELDPTGTDVASRGSVAAAQAAADVVAAVLPQRYRGRVRPVLCHVRDLAMAELAGDVLVTSPSTFEHIVSSSPVVLSTSEVNDVSLRLDAGLEAFPVPQPPKRRRRRARRVLLAALVAASSGAVGVVLAQEPGGLRLPW